MKEDDDEEEGSISNVKYPCMPSLVALQQMRNRLHLAYVGKKLMKWTAMATNRELRKVAEEINQIYGNFGEDAQNAYIMLARARFHEPELNQMVLQNVGNSANVTVEVTAKSVTGVKIMHMEILDNEDDHYAFLGLGKGGEIIAEARAAWRSLLKREVSMVEERTSFKDLDVANKNATKRQNVFAKIAIPKIKATIAFILYELEEMAREDNYRMKMIQKKKHQALAKKEQLKKKKTLMPIPEKELPTVKKPIIETPIRERPVIESPKIEPCKIESPKTEPPKSEIPKINTETKEICETCGLRILPEYELSESEEELPPREDVCKCGDKSFIAASVESVIDLYNKVMDMLTRDSEEDDNKEEPLEVKQKILDITQKDQTRDKKEKADVSQHLSSEKVIAPSKTLNITKKASSMKTMVPKKASDTTQKQEKVTPKVSCVKIKIPEIEVRKEEYEKSVLANETHQKVDKKTHIGDECVCLKDKSIISTGTCENICPMVKEKSNVKETIKEITPSVIINEKPSPQIQKLVELKECTCAEDKCKETCSGYQIDQKTKEEILAGTRSNKDVVENKEFLKEASLTRDECLCLTNKSIKSTETCENICPVLQAKSKSNLKDRKEEIPTIVEAKLTPQLLKVVELKECTCVTNKCKETCTRYELLTETGAKQKVLVDTCLNKGFVENQEILVKTSSKVKLEESVEKQKKSSVIKVCSCANHREKSFLKLNALNFMETCKHFYEKLNEYLSTDPCATESDGASKKHLDELKYQIKDMTKVTKEYKEQGLLDIDINDFIKSCNDVISSIDGYTAQGPELKETPCKSKSKETLIKQESEKSSCLEDFNECCKEFRSKLDDYTKKGKKPPAESSSRDRSEGKGYKLDDVIGIIFKSKQISSRSVEELLRNLEMSNQDSDVLDNECKMIYPSNSDTCTCNTSLLSTQPSTRNSLEELRSTILSTPLSSCKFCQGIVTKKKEDIACLDECSKTSDSEKWQTCINTKKSVKDMCEACKRIYAENIKESKEPCTKSVKLNVESKKSDTKSAKSTKSTQSVHSKCALSSEEIEIQPDSVGYFEKNIRTVIRVTRTKNPDGTIKEEKDIVVVKTEKHNPDESPADETVDKQ